VKNEKLKPLYNKAKKLLTLLPAVKVILVPREANRISDRLAKKASDIELKSPADEQATP
jgi:hypothetical protein